MINLLFLTRALNFGGAQRQLAELVGRIDKSRFKVTIMTFYDGGALWPEIEKIPGVTLVSLGKKGRYDLLSFTGRLLKALKQIKPDVIHTYIGGNEFASLARRFLRFKLIFGIRASNMELDRYDWLEPLLFRLSARLAWKADLLIANSHAGKAYHVQRGYPADRTIVIQNGFDVDRFHPNRALGQDLRREWGIPDDAVLIGNVGRLDPMKDHKTFLRAASLLIRDRSTVRFVCVGDGDAKYREELQQLGDELGLSSRVIWAGPSTAMAAAYNALDICTLCSAYGEGVPNVIGEAMACGTPCVTTDVGDAAELLGDPTRVVPIGRPQAIADAWGQLLDMPKESLRRIGEEERNRIVRHFSLVQLQERTERAIEDMLAGGAAAGLKCNEGELDRLATAGD